MCAEKVSRVPFGAAGDDDFAFDGCFAGFSARGEGFVVVEVAEEAVAFVAIVVVVVFGALFCEVVTLMLMGMWVVLTSLDASEALASLVFGFGVEGYAL